MNWILLFKMHQTEMLIFIFIFGAIIGSFLNVVIYRYPIMLQREWNDECQKQLNQPPLEKPAGTFNLCTPRSHCASCQKQIPWWFNIPILSYVFLRGKCAYCHARIPVHNILVEIMSALLPLLVVVHFGITAQSFILILLTWGLITLSFIDITHQFLPDLITYVLLWLGLLVSTRHFFVSPSQAILGATIGYLFLWAIAKLYTLLRKKEGMGLGDCKMLAMIGAWVGVMGLLNVLFFSTLLALIISLILLSLKKINSNNPIPFGPYLAIAGWCTAIYGPQFLYWMLRCL